MIIDLDVFLEIKGEYVKVGTIKGTHPQDARFQYSEDYMDSRSSVPVSISLPFQKKPFSNIQTEYFFGGLLPEGFVRKQVAMQSHKQTGDYTGMLSILGSECIGAIRIAEHGTEAPEPAYVPLTHEDVAALAKEGTLESVDLVIKSHLSLTGASGKVGLYYDKQNKRWYLPVGDAPSTHIVKQSHVRLGSIVLNEQLSLMTARRLGLEVPDSFIISEGGFTDDKVLLATERYDRIFPDGRRTRMISGLPRPVRMHQEDFGECLGITDRYGIYNQYKYEEPGQDYLVDMFRILKDHSSEPIHDQLKLWDIAVFDFLTGNTDNHIKNLSLLYTTDLKSMRLAPAYDIVSTCIYPGSTENMAFNIGGDYDINQINRDSFRREAEKLNLNSRILLERFDRLAEDFDRAITDTASELEDMGFTNALEIRDRILANGGIAHL